MYPGSSDEVEFYETVKRLRHIGYGRMIQIIAHEWEETHPGAGLLHTRGRPTESDRREFYAQREADPLTVYAGWRRLSRR